jgi:hypothetical protein
MPSSRDQSSPGNCYSTAAERVAERGVRAALGAIGQGRERHHKNKHKVSSILTLLCISCKMSQVEAARGERVCSPAFGRDREQQLGDGLRPGDDLRHRSGCSGSSARQGAAWLGQASGRTGRGGLPRTSRVS